MSVLAQIASSSAIGVIDSTTTTSVVDATQRTSVPLVVPSPFPPGPTARKYNSDYIS